MLGGYYFWHSDWMVSLIKHQPIAEIMSDRNVSEIGTLPRELLTNNVILIDHTEVNFLKLPYTNAGAMHCSNSRLVLGTTNKNQTKHKLDRLS